MFFPPRCFFATIQKDTEKAGKVTKWNLWVDLHFEALRIGSDNTIYLLWNGTVDLTNFAPERIFFSRSTDHGKSYSPRVDVSDAPGGIEHCFPAIAVGRDAGDVRIGWMDERTGAWNVFFR
jgi:hypothetical protein